MVISPDDKAEIGGALLVGLLVCACLWFLVSCGGCNLETPASAVNRGMDRIEKKIDSQKPAADYSAELRQLQTSIDSLKQPTQVIPSPVDSQKLADLEERLATISKDIADLKKRRCLCGCK